MIQAVASTSNTHSSTGPERTCIGCRERGDPLSMIRFVCDADGHLQVDLRQRMPGRGAYLHARPACVRRANKGSALDRSLGRRTRRLSDEALLARMTLAAHTRFEELLGLARRAGEVALGTEAVRRAVKENRAQLVVVASDASGGTQTAIAANCARKEVPVIAVPNGTALARPLGEDYLAAVAVCDDPFAMKLTALASTLRDCLPLATKGESPRSV